ncbi:MAG: NUDIX hydrolase [Candidatus Woesearchaeota archaeon]
MKEYERKGYRKPFLATDIIIEYNDGQKEGIILITRKNPPHGIAIPGGFAEYGLSLEENALKEAREETGLGIILENPENPFCVHSNPDRDPRSHVISVVYIARGQGELCAGDDAKTATLYTIEELLGLLGSGELVFDHERILLKYLEFRGHIK